MVRHGRDRLRGRAQHGGRRAGLQSGDVLLMIDGRAVDRVEDVVNALHGSPRGAHLRYTILRMQAKQQATSRCAGAVSPLGLYFALAAVGVFSLLVGASVRLRRPDHQATLHFFWLTVAFFGTMAFSFTGKLDALDWTFTGETDRAAALRRCSCTSRSCFRSSRCVVRSDAGRALVPAIYCGTAARRRVGRGVING